MSAAGLEISGADNTKYFNNSTQVFKKLGEFTITSQVDGSITNDVIVGKSLSYNLISIVLIHDGAANNNIYPKYIRENGNKIEWEFRKNVYAKDRDQTIYNLTFDYGWYS